MTLIQSFLFYAQEFEKTYRDDEWMRILPFFASDAVYEVQNISFACRVEGAQAILDAICRSVNGFDRRVGDRRIEVLAPPTQEGDEVHVQWAVTYSHGDHPPLRVAARTVARYENGRIVYLADVYEPGSDEVWKKWVEQVDPSLDPSYV
ncbi:MAG: nuclear transport factor 2 family protein [Acidobacteriota bacterium]|nr:nuclear transport factor 2 family protein [Acidobacteriota bacterium]